MAELWMLCYLTSNGRIGVWADYDASSMDAAITAMMRDPRAPQPSPGMLTVYKYEDGIVQFVCETEPHQVIEGTVTE